MLLEARVVSMFFDRKGVVDRVAVADRRNLSKAGAMVRGYSRRSIKYRKSRDITSAPGSAPYEHQKGLGIRTHLFGYDAAKHTVVIGPARLGGTFDPNAPKNLEAGGSAVIKVRKKRPGGKYKPRLRNGVRRSPAELKRIKEYYINKRDPDQVKKKRITIKPRPFMGPALAASKPKITALWRDTVKP